MSNKDFFEKVGSDHSRGSRSQRPDEPVTTSSGFIAVEAEKRPFTGAAVKKWSRDFKLFFGTAPTEELLPAGMYRASMHPHYGPCLDSMPVTTDNLIELPDQEHEAILKEFRDFWSIEDRFRERGFLFKRGFLLWGPPGGGKTSTLQLLIKRIVDEMNGVVLVIDHPVNGTLCMKLLREIEPNRPLLCVLEDIDALIERTDESMFLSMLDGENQVDRVCTIATTNYPERLDARFVDRPSRFDTIKRIGMPTAAARRVYLSAKEPSLGGAELDEWVKVSEDFSVAHLKEMIIGVRCFGQPLAEVVGRLRDMIDHYPKSTDDSTKVVGFTPRQRLRP